MCMFTAKKKKEKKNTQKDQRMGKWQIVILIRIYWNTETS